MKKRGSTKKESQSDSSKIERLYHAEKERIEEAAKHLEKEKCKAYLRLMGRRKRSIQVKMSQRMVAVRRLHLQIKQLKAKQNQLLQKIGQVLSKNDQDVQTLRKMDLERKRLVSEIKHFERRQK